MGRVKVTRVDGARVVEVEQVKPGIRSTEFWAVSLAFGLVMLISVLNRMFGWDIEFSEADAGTLVAALVAVYVGGRSLVKAIVEGTKGKVAAEAARDEPARPASEG